MATPEYAVSLKRVLTLRNKTSIKIIHNIYITVLLFSNYDIQSMVIKL